MLVSGEIHHHTGNIRYSMFSPSNHAVEHSNELSNENSILVDNGSLIINFSTADATRI